MNTAAISVNISLYINQFVTRLPISYTQTLFATRRGVFATRRTLLVTRKRLFVKRLDRGNFKEIHILNIKIPPQHCQGQSGNIISASLLLY